MAILNLKILASLLQMHGPNATIQSDHQGIDAILGDIRGQLSNDTAPAATLPLTASPKLLSAEARS